MCNSKKKKKIDIRVDVEDYELFKTICYDNKTTPSSIIRNLISKYIIEKEKEKKD